MAAPAIGRRARWAPGPTAKMDWSHPLAAGLVEFWIYRGGVLHAVASGRQLTAAVAVTDAPTAFGAGFKVQNLADSGFKEPANTRFSTTSKTVAVLGTLPSAATNTNGNLFHLDTELILRYNGSALNFFHWTGGTFRSITATPPAKGQHLFSASINVDAQMSLYIDGQRKTGPTSQPTPVNLSANPLGLMRHGADGIAPSISAEPAADVTALAWWNRALGDVEHAQLYADPFCMLTT